VNFRWTPDASARLAARRLAPEQVEDLFYGLPLELEPVAGGEPALRLLLGQDRTNRIHAVAWAVRDGAIEVLTAFPAPASLRRACLGRGGGPRLHPLPDLATDEARVAWLLKQRQALERFFAPRVDDGRVLHEFLALPPRRQARLRSTALRIGQEDFLEIERRAAAAGLDRTAYLRRLIQRALAQEWQHERFGAADAWPEGQAVAEA